MLHCSWYEPPAALCGTLTLPPESPWPQVSLVRLALLRIIMGVSFALTSSLVGGYSYPWLQAMMPQLLSYLISVGIDLRYRSIYRRHRAEEAAFAAAASHKAASKLQGLLADAGGACTPGRWWADPAAYP